MTPTPDFYLFTDQPGNEETVQVVLALKLEGFVAKRRSSIYMPGARTFDWRKVKRPGWQQGRRWVNQ